MSQPLRYPVRRRAPAPCVRRAVLGLWLAVGACTGAAWAQSGDDAEAQGPWFVDVAAQAGVEFTYRNGRTGEYLFPEIMGGGAAVLDVDGDDLLDLYFVQGGTLVPDANAGAAAAPDRAQDRLYRNVSKPGADGRLVLRFEDVTAASGIRATGYGMGVAVGDIDADGDPDILALNVGANQLWRNDGGGRFSDITATAGVGGAEWSVSASFADLDGDALPDLYIANYAQFSLDRHKRCRAHGTSAHDYCSPSAYPGSADRLYRNLGGGRFEDVSETAGIAAPRRHGLGVVAADLDGDGRTDLYVANDGDPNHFWVNQGGEYQGGMRFRDEAMLAGNAVNADGAAEAGMGVDAGDVDRDGDEDLFVTHMKRETNTLYVNDGSGWFEDRTAAAGLAAPSIPSTGFGTAFVDLDNDGWLDLVAANGAVMQEQSQAGEAYPYRQPDQVFHNDGTGRFADASARAGPAFSAAAAAVGRGAAFGDLDNDGRVDVVIVNSEGPARVLLNRMRSGHHWLGLRLVDAKGVEQTGAVVTRIDATPPQRRRARNDGSYASANDGRVQLGLGTDTDAQAVEVRWPDGSRERHAPLAVDRYHTLRKGTGAPAGAAAQPADAPSDGATPDQDPRNP